MIYYLKVNYRKILSFLIFLHLGLIYLPNAISNIVFGVIVLFYIYGIIAYVQPFDFNKKWKWYFIIIIPFLLTLISVILSKEYQYGFNYLWQRLPVLIYPFIFLSVSPNKVELISGIRIFLVLTLLAIVKSLYNLIIDNPTHFYILNTDLSSKLTVIQHIYLGVLCIIALVFTIEYFKNSIKKINLFFLLLIILVGAIISTSRITYILLFILTLYYLYKFFNKKKFILFGVLFSVFSVLFVYTNQSIKYKFERIFVFEESPRLLFWNNAYQVLKNSKNPILGVGIGDYYAKKEQSHLLKGYYLELKPNFRGLYGYYSHNQYIEFLLLNGVLGLFFILGIFYFIFITFKNRNALPIILMLILASLMMTESIFIRQYGIMIYIFIMSFVANSFVKKEKSNEGFID
jgi:O-antigen ligase